MTSTIVYGLHPVLAVLRAQRRPVHKLWIADHLSSRKLEPLAVQARQNHVTPTTVPQVVIDKLAGGGVHQGVLVETEPYPEESFQKILEAPSEGPGSPMLLMLDCIVDPHNLGALVRTAVGVGIQGIIIPKKGAVGPTPTVMKASSGALEFVRLAMVANLSKALEMLKKDGYWVFGLAPRADHSLFVCDLTEPLVIVIGGEERGLRPLVGRHCDHLVSIPQMGAVGSLNASVAGAVVMYEALRQRLNQTLR